MNFNSGVFNTVAAWKNAKSIIRNAWFCDYITWFDDCTDSFTPSIVFKTITWFIFGNIDLAEVSAKLMLVLIVGVLLDNAIGCLIEFYL